MLVITFAAAELQITSYSSIPNVKAKNKLPIVIYLCLSSCFILFPPFFHL